MSCDIIVIDKSTSTIIIESKKITEIVTENEINFIVEASPEFIIDINNLIEILEVCKQGPPGPQGPPGNIGEFQFSTDVAATDTEVLDQIDILTIRAAKWIIVIEDNTNSLYQYFDFSSLNDGGTTTQDILSARMGDSFNYDIDSSINGSFIDLVFTNNSIVDDVTVKTVRINVNI